MAETVYIAVTPQMRALMRALVENMIGLIDEIDGDENLEETGDLEPNIGWTGEGRGTVGLDLSEAPDDEREQENEHGGDILDEPHDLDDEGDTEPFLGWSEKCGQGPVVGVDICMSDVEPDEAGVSERLPGFDGNGRRIARDMLRNIRPARDPDELVFIAPGRAIMGDGAR